MKQWGTAYQTNRKRGNDMPKNNEGEYEVLKDRISEEIYSWDGAESGWGDDAVENVLEILDDFLEKQENQVRK